MLCPSFTTNHEGVVVKIHLHIVLCHTWKVGAHDQSIVAFDDLDLWSPRAFGQCFQPIKTSFESRREPAASETKIFEESVHLFAESPHESKRGTRRKPAFTATNVSARSA